MKIFQAAALLLAMFASLTVAAPEPGTVLIQTDNTQYIRTG